jgi:micrococcal nuclease
MILGKEVKLERGIEDIDIYGRLLRFVFLDDNFINLLLVREGYATVFIVDPEEKYVSELYAAEQIAKDRKLFLWRTSDFSSCIKITDFQYKGEEHVEFYNECDYPIKMDAWEVKDEATHIYKFKTFTLSAKSSFTLFTSIGSNTGDKLFWNSKTTIWNNDGDTLFLRDDKGNLVLSHKYP